MREQLPIERHPFEPFLPEGARMLFLGSFPPQPHRWCMPFYDTACEVRRLKDNASDAFLEVVTTTDIPALLSRIPSCHKLITTGEKATGVVVERFGCPVPAIGTYV